MTNKCLDPTTSSLTGTIARPSGRDGIIVDHPDCDRDGGADLAGAVRSLGVVGVGPPGDVGGDHGGDAPAAGAVGIGAQQGVAAGAGLQPGEGTTPLLSW